MIKFFEKIKGGLFVASIFLAIFVIRDQRQTIEIYKASEGMIQGGDIAKQEYIDSLKNELFIQSTNVTRYEIALERLKEVDIDAANKFEKQLSNIE